MIRTTLTLYLALATAAGPSLCCCAMGEVRALGRTGAGQADRTPERCPCCGAAHATPRPTSGHRDRGAASWEEPSPAPAERCPCREHPAAPVVLSTVAADTIVWACDLTPAGLTLTTLPPPATAPASPRGAEEGWGHPLPFHASNDLLRVFHLLRC
jgi:hypothetical protein